MKRILAIITTLILVISLSACVNKGNKTAELNIYVKSSQTNELVAEKVKYTGSKNTVDMANFVISKLNEGPNEKGNERSIPENVTFSAVVIKNESATIDFSKNFTSFSGTDEILARFAVVRTLCEVPGITSVLITIEGEPLVSDETGKEIGYLSWKDVVLDIGGNNENSNEEKTTVSINLYFATSDAMALKLEQRKVTTHDTLSIEKTVINELLKGPTSQELTSAIPEGTKLISAETKDTICYVNLSQEFITKFPGGTGMLSVYSIVNSLCSIESISSVQILIEGEKGAEFGNYVFDSPIEKNLNLVQQN